MAEQFLKNSKSDLQNTSLSQLKTFQIQEIKKHNTKEDIWVILNGRVYDITTMLPKHPGGEDIILNQIQKNHDLTEIFYKMEHSADAIDFVKDVCVGSFEREILGWGDLFSTKVELLDYQHGTLIQLMNDIYCKGSIHDLDKFVKLWIIHCESEEYFMKQCKFAEDKQLSHIHDHERITGTLEKYYKELVEKYAEELKPKKKEDVEKKEKEKANDKENEEAKEKVEDEAEKEVFKCEELCAFIKMEMVPGFKKHAFAYDSLYVDKLGDSDPSLGIASKINEMGLMQPIFPENPDDT